MVSQSRSEGYKTIIKTLYPNTQTISVWGGEDNDPPVYGNVYVSLKPISGVTLTDTAKTNLQTQLKDYSVGSVRVQFSDPEITYITYRTTARYNSKVTTKSIDDIKTLINNTISNYSSTNLEKFPSHDPFVGVKNLCIFIVVVLDNTEASVSSIASINLEYLNIPSNFSKLVEL